MEKVLMITGASSGIGRATALEAAKQGYRLLLAARREDLLQDLDAEIGADRALDIAADITDFDQLSRAVESGLQKFGQLDAATRITRSTLPSGVTASWSKRLTGSVS